MVGVVRTAKGLAVLALVFALSANLLGMIGNGIRSQENCSKIEFQKTIQREEENEALRRIKSGQFDEEFQNIFGNDWVEQKQQAIKDAERLIAKLKPESCPFPILWWTT
jgi:hypothetical protein